MLGRKFDQIQIDRYVMHQLYELEQTALSSYAQYNFPKGKLTSFRPCDLLNACSSHFHPNQFHEHNTFVSLL